MDISTHSLEFALLISLLAGLTTVAGSLVAFFTKKTNTKMLCYALSFSAGAMLFFSFSHLLPETVESLRQNYTLFQSYLYGTLAFGFGILFIYVMGEFFFKDTDIHKGFPHKTMPDLHTKPKKLSRLSGMSVLAVTIHNFPEGMATFISALQGKSMGYAVAIAIALHNIPEGITISVPVYYSTGSRAKAIFVSFLAALAEPVGAIIGYLLLRALVPVPMFPVAFAFAAGIMVFISLEELIPTSREYGGGKEVIIGLLLGMAFMSLSLGLHS